MKRLICITTLLAWSSALAADGYLAISNNVMVIGPGGTGGVAGGITTNWTLTILGDSTNTLQFSQGILTNISGIGTNAPPYVPPSSYFAGSEQVALSNVTTYFSIDGGVLSTNTQADVYTYIPKSIVVTNLSFSITPNSTATNWIITLHTNVTATAISAYSPTNSLASRYTSTNGMTLPAGSFISIALTKTNDVADVSRIRWSLEYHE